MNGNENITCKAHGKPGQESYLRWEREESTGKRTLIDASRVFRKEETTTTYHIDVDILSFKNFSKADAGKYICVRQLDDNDPTERAINIELERKIRLPSNFHVSIIYLLNPG